ncbi:MAG: ATP-binding cassette domain-containing protein [Parabacteroides sp.]
MRTHLITLCILLTLWQLVAWLIHQPALWPTVDQLLVSFLQLWGDPSFYRSLLATCGRALLGLWLSLLLAVGTACISAKHPGVRCYIRPWLTLMRSVPVISFILFALIFLDPEKIPLLVAFLTMFPLLTENLTEGLRTLSPNHKRMARLFRIGGWDRMAYLYYAPLRPFLFSGLASAMGFGWRAIIMGEVLGQCAEGIGGQMKRAQLFIDVPQLLSWTLTALLLSFLTEKAIAWLSRRRIPFHYAAPRHPFLPLAPEEIVLEAVGCDYGIPSFSHRFCPQGSQGRIYALCAPSGTGKSTLLALLDGTQRPTSGTLRIDRSHGIASLFEEAELLPDLTVSENLLLPLKRCYSRPEAMEQAEHYLTALHIEALAHRYPTELSYGEQRRVALVRALLFPSPFLFLDEPFKGLDPALAEEASALIAAQRACRSVILITGHQPQTCQPLADEVIRLQPFPGVSRK